MGFDDWWSQLGVMGVNTLSIGVLLVRSDRASIHIQHMLTTVELSNANWYRSWFHLSDLFYATEKVAFNDECEITFPNDVQKRRYVISVRNLSVEWFHTYSFARVTTYLMVDQQQSILERTALLNRDLKDLARQCWMNCSWGKRDRSTS